MKIHIILLFNGIGNQLSQYALYKQIRSENKFTFLINNCSIIPGYTKGLDILEIEPTVEKDLMNKLLSKVIIFYLKVLGQNKFLLLKKMSYFLSNILSIKIINETNYPSKKRFINIYADGWLNKVIKNPCNIYNDSFISYLNEHGLMDSKYLDENICAIHFRGGDYIDGGINSEIYGNISDFNYYDRAISKMKNRKRVKKFVIFTNDKKAAEPIFKKLNLDFIFSDELGSKSFLEDLCFMSIFKRLIISNSSFSFWSAATFTKDKYVICPNRYRNKDDIDIYLSQWDKI